MPSKSLLYHLWQLSFTGLEKTRKVTDLRVGENEHFWLGNADLEMFVGHQITHIAGAAGNKSGAQEVVWAGDKSTGI